MSTAALDENDKNVMPWWNGLLTGRPTLTRTPLTAAERDANRRNELRQTTEKKEQSYFKVVSKFSSASASELKENRKRRLTVGFV